MAHSSRALLSLCSCFCGVVPRDADWIALLALANHTWTTPALMNLVRSKRAAIPDDVAGFIEELHTRSAIRSDRMAAQLEEAVLALNSSGITPVLVKGTALLATCSPSDRALRLMSDLDIVVRPDEIEGAIKALAGIGYIVDYESNRLLTKWYVDLSRPHDVGMIDLHEALPGEAFLDQSADELHSSLHPVSFGAARALVPSRELQALVLVLHDQFQDHDYWTGSIDLRHLLDLRDLFAAPPGIREEAMNALASSGLVRNAVEAQRLLLSRLLGLGWPAGRPQRLAPRVQVWRQLLRARHPLLRVLVLPLGLVNLPSYRAQTRVRIPASVSDTPPQARKGWLPKFGHLLFLLSLSGRHRVGKL